MAVPPRSGPDVAPSLRQRVPRRRARADRPEAAPRSRSVAHDGCRDRRTRPDPDRRDRAVLARPAARPPSPRRAGRSLAHRPSEPEAMIRVAIVDDHPAVRLGLHAALAAEPAFVPVGAASSATEVGPLLYRTDPDVVLLDYQLPDVDGLTLCRELKLAVPARRVILYSAFADASMTVPAIVAGADGIVHKSVRPQELFEAIRAVAAGGDALPHVSPGPARGSRHPARCRRPADPRHARRQDPSQRYRNDARHQRRRARATRRANARPAQGPGPRACALARVVDTNGEYCPLRPGRVPANACGVAQRLVQST